MPTRGETYSKELDRLIKSFDRLDAQAMSSTMGLLKDYSGQVRQAVVGAERWEAFWLPRIEAEIGRATADFAERYRKELAGLEDQAFDIGQQAVDLPMEAIGLNVQMPLISRSLLEIQQGFSADLVGGLGSEMLAKVNRDIRLGVMGAETPFNTMKRISRYITPLEITTKKGKRNLGFAWRAETITRTEMNRTYSVANHARGMAASEQFPAMKKAWLATHDGRARAGHLAAESEYGEGGTPGPIPISQNYIVAGDLLMYPGQPGKGSASNVVNCRCREVFLPPVEEPAELEEVA